MKAVLCWTEFYNGKWQPSKTSDLARPTIIGVFDPSGEGSFEAVRELLNIVPGLYGGSAALLGVVQNIEGALLLAIEPAGWAYAAGTQNRGPAPFDTTGRGFLLHNTHSLPIRFEDLTLNNIPMRVLLDPPPYGRQLTPLYEYTGNSVGPTPFIIDYFTTANVNTPSQTAYSSDVLNFTWQPRFAQAQPQPDTTGWTNPFFYEDRKSVFYVTSTAHFYFRIIRHTVFGVAPASAASGSRVSIPPILRPGLNSTALLGVSAAASLANPATSTVSFRGAAIGPSGILKPTRRS